MLGDGFLSEQLEDDGPHQIPLVLKLQGPFVLEERYGTGGRKKRKSEKTAMRSEKVREDTDRT